jgi:hypothetical protein
MKRISLAILLSILTSPAYGTITITGISGVSSSSIVANTTAAPAPGQTAAPAVGTASATIYGGLAGTCPNLPGSGLTCNSCDPTQTTSCTNAAGVNEFPLCACNPARIYPGLPITITITESAATMGYVRAYIGEPGTVGQEVPYATPPALGTGTVSFFWGTGVCAFENPSDPQCAAVTSQTVSITIWVDNTAGGTGVYASTNDSVPLTFKIQNPGTEESVFGNSASEGVGQFTPFPGDERIYLTNINAATTFPALTTYEAIIATAIMYASPNHLDDADAANTSIPIGNLTVSSDASGLDQDFMTGVTNGTPYYVRLAMQDQAGNIVQYYPDGKGTDQNGTPHPECFGASPTLACPFAVVPDQVLGILSKDINCFVATAAYGSALEPKIKIFRDFRFYILLRHEWGKRFVISYYRYGPYAARFIADKPVLRAMARGILWPLAGFSWLALKIGLVNSLMISLILITALIALPWLGLRRRFARA